MFLLSEVLKLERYAALPAFAEAPSGMVQAVLEEAARFSEEVLAPLNRVGDREGCRWVDGEVTTPTGFRDAYRALADGGWVGLSAPAEWGGQGLPRVVDLAVQEMMYGANMAFAMYPGLVHGAVMALESGGSEALKALYLPKLVSGEWAGTMALTEPQCGTDLGLIRTRATPDGEGRYRLNGQKIWNSGAEQDLTENIVHLVLARLDGAPPGTRGLSLFLVPKFIPDSEGRPGERNAALCVGIEEKMGVHGNATCAMAYEDAVGWLVGEPNRGLATMFLMMNAARLSVGVQGVALGHAATQAAADFARDRRQGRAAGTRETNEAADPIIVHPDVRRMLMDSRAVVEGGRAFLLWTALQEDLAHGAGDPAVRERAADYAALMTPVVKAFLTDRGFRACSEAVQVHGGSGYTEHFPVSQFMRDARVSMIFEGTNGVQALDLVGRKLPAENGRAIKAFLDEVDAAAGAADPVLTPFADGLARARATLAKATEWLHANAGGDPNAVGAAASDYLQLFGLTALAHMWLRMAAAAQARIAAGDPDPFYAWKLATGRSFVERVLPEAGACLAKLKAGPAAVMALPPEAF